MKFLQKHKNKIFALCLAAVLLSCFMGFSFFSSAANITATYPISDFSVFAVNKSPNYSTPFTKDGDTFVLGPVSSLDSVQPYWSYFAISIKDFFDPPYVEGRTVLLSLSLDLIVEKDSSINLALQNGYDILTAAAFRNCNLQINNGRLISPEQYIVRDPYGVVRDPLDSSFWSQYAGSNQYDLSIDILFDITDYIEVDFVNAYIFFPRIDQAPTLSLWASPYEDTYRFRVDNFNYTYVYKPFSDIVQDDLTDIKGSLSGVNNKLDFISSSMNTIDQDINRVEQSVSDLRDDLTQGDPDIESSNSDLQDQITDARDEIGVIDSEINSIVSDIMDKYPDAENPFDAPDVPILSDIWASEFIEELWGFFKAQSIFFTFIHTGLLFCLVSFILRR